MHDIELCRLSLEKFSSLFLYILKGAILFRMVGLVGKTKLKLAEFPSSYGTW